MTTSRPQSRWPPEQLSSFTPTVWLNGATNQSRSASNACAWRSRRRWSHVRWQPRSCTDSSVRPRRSTTSHWWSSKQPRPRTIQLQSLPHLNRTTRDARLGSPTARGLQPARPPLRRGRDRRTSARVLRCSVRADVPLVRPPWGPAVGTGGRRPRRSRQRSSRPRHVPVRRSEQSRTSAHPTPRPERDADHGPALAADTWAAGHRMAIDSCHYAPIRTPRRRASAPRSTHSKKTRQRHRSCARSSSSASLARATTASHDTSTNAPSPLPPHLTERAILIAKRTVGRRAR